jgi:hypothetical protein
MNYRFGWQEMKQGMKEMVLGLELGYTSGNGSCNAKSPNLPNSTRLGRSSRNHRMHCMVTYTMLLLRLSLKYNSRQQILRQMTLRNEGGCTDGISEGCSN